MDKRWSIMDRSDVKEKCFQMEAVVRNIFKSPTSWANGFIRLVSLEGTWYQHRATDIFIPVEQGLIDKLYRSDKRPEKSPIRINSGVIFWDYLKEDEALQILPNLPSSNMPKMVGTASGLGEKCRNKKIFLKDGNRIYEEENKRIRLLQKNEEATILQIYRLEDQYKRTDKVSWNYDIYLWAKVGVIPSALYSSKESWNTMQFLINNFYSIDFTDFLSIEEKASVSGIGSFGKTEDTEKSEQSETETMEKTEASGETKTSEKQETLEKPEATGVSSSPLSAEITGGTTETSGITGGTVQPETSGITAGTVRPEASGITTGTVRPEASGITTGTVRPEASGITVGAVQPEASGITTGTVRPEATGETTGTIRPETSGITGGTTKAFPSSGVSEGLETTGKSGISARSEQVGAMGSVRSETAEKSGISVKPDISGKTGIPIRSEMEEKSETQELAKPKILSKPENPVKSENSENQNRFPTQSRFQRPNYNGKSEKFHMPSKYEQVKQTERAEETRKNQREENTNEKRKMDIGEKIQELLECDKNRCRLEPYDKDILFDIVRGHWELFEERLEDEQDIYAEDAAGEEEETFMEERRTASINRTKEDLKEKTEEKEEKKDSYKNLIARNPRLDIKDGVVGIDFGTKSTVVVRQDSTNRIVPVRIGTGNLSNEVKEDDFENPTIIEFTNVKKFLENYQSRAGRPYTSCNDIFVSYDAYEDFRNCKPDDFYAYFSELKQWANSEKGNVLIKDKQKDEYYLSENIDSLGGNVNPIELYAYYIGLYINNMRNGIYLKYLMTFPVGYTKEVRDFIAKSFSEGIKKSLPSSILMDEECMSQFKVQLGISEPAAYAVTALEQKNLEPKDETEQYMYGIFDFGGGTTDFDFGIWRGATEEEYEKEAYDYILECFGADSDVTLGGENILELMAYHVYQRNLDLFREKRITFTLPLGEHGFAGSETLLINSQISKRNMSILKEELRPLWHQEQGWRKKYQLDNETVNEADKEGIVVSLYNMDGEPVPQCILEFSSQDLLELIKNRIQKGIDGFFQCLKKRFLNREEIKKEDPVIYIFLAGNSSKSIFVKELFQKKIEDDYNKAKKTADEVGNVYFELIEPLTGESNGDSSYMPNAKTGVAYGLLKSRVGSSIKIKKNYETDALQQSRFHYYLGRERRRHFDCKLSPTEIEYGRWIAFQGATREVVRIYYTNNPMADSRVEQMPIDNVPYKELFIDVREEAYLFIRTVEPDVLEYTLAENIESISEDEIRKCYFN